MSLLKSITMFSDVVRPKITRIHPNIMLPYSADSILIKSENNVQTTVRDPAILVTPYLPILVMRSSMCGLKFQEMPFLNWILCAVLVLSHSLFQWYEPLASTVQRRRICILYLSCCNQPVGEVCTPKRPLQIGPGPFRKVIRRIGRDDDDPSATPATTRFHAATKRSVMSGCACGTVWAQSTVPTVFFSDHPG